MKIMVSGPIISWQIDEETMETMSLKTNFDNVLTVYVDTDKKKLLASILEKKCSNEDKVSRIISIDDERRNEEICDFVVNSDNIDEATDSILEHLKTE